jgi:hypothetical protein
MYNILCGYIVFNDGHGYRILMHLMQYYYKLKVAYNKYYLKYMMAVSHKPTFVMARRDLIPYIIEKRLKENSMETP